MLNIIPIATDKRSTALIKVASLKANEYHQRKPQLHIMQVLMDCGQYSHNGNIYITVPAALAQGTSLKTQWYYCYGKSQGLEVCCEKVSPSNS